METPEDRERKKYQWKEFQRRWKLINRIGDWLPAALLAGFFILSRAF
jgi:hypothetical protein